MQGVRKKSGLARALCCHSQRRTMDLRGLQSWRFNLTLLTLQLHFGAALLAAFGFGLLFATTSVSGIMPAGRFEEAIGCSSVTFTVFALHFGVTAQQDGNMMRACVSLLCFANRVYAASRGARKLRSLCPHGTQGYWFTTEVEPTGYLPRCPHPPKISTVCQRRGGRRHTREVLGLRLQGLG